MILLWQAGWLPWSPEVLSDPYRSIIPWLWTSQDWTESDSGCLLIRVSAWTSSHSWGVAECRDCAKCEGENSLGIGLTYEVMGCEAAARTVHELSRGRKLNVHTDRAFSSNLQLTEVLQNVSEHQHNQNHIKAVPLHSCSPLDDWVLLSESTNCVVTLHQPFSKTELSRLLQILPRT